MDNALKLIAFYLPQYHPIPENDVWWGKGFTEWTNTAKATPMFRGHYQPHVPADLGFYDLRVPETRIAQAELAKEYGIHAFCYYHYWFEGKQLLERPFNEVLISKKPDFPFCLCWANETWTGIWHECKDRILIEQTYSDDDNRKHFNHLLKAFSDDRYVLIDNKPLFMVYRPLDLPDSHRVTDLWREMALNAGLKGLYLIGVNSPYEWVPANNGFDACVRPTLPQWPYYSKRNLLKWLLYHYNIKIGKPSIYPFDLILDYMIENTNRYLEKYPYVIPNWDNTPRSGTKGRIMHGSTPEGFRRQVRKAIELVNDNLFKHKIIFIKSWNEWAEGNHLEPDLKYGKAYLEVLREELLK